MYIRGVYRDSFTVSIYFKLCGQLLFTISSCRPKAVAGERLHEIPGATEFPRKKKKKKKNRKFNK
jgi:hypothetical protein